MAVQTNFLAAVNQIAAERNIDATEVLKAISKAIETGFRQNYSEESDVKLKVEIDPDGGQISVNREAIVVDEVTDEDTQISLEEAQALDESLKVGDEVLLDITPDGDFGRVAAQAAKQVIMQEVRDSEREVQLRAFEDRIGEIEFAVVQRVDGDSIIWEVGRALAVMPHEDRIMSEFYRSGSRHKVLLKEIRETERGRTLIVSRAAPEFLQALFELEVPELGSGSVEIKKIAREAGSRSKVAVASSVDGIDPIGSCVGQRGVRINAIMNELKSDNGREEKIDIILWSDDQKQFIANALSPAEVADVEIIDEDELHAKVIVPQDQLSLAIGRDGQNVRLAAKATGWKIDVASLEGGDVIESSEGSDMGSEPDSEKASETEETTISDDAAAAGSLEELGLSTRTITSLESAGIVSVEGLKEINDPTTIDGIGPKAAEEITAALEK